MIKYPVKNGRVVFKLNYMKSYYIFRPHMVILEYIQYWSSIIERGLYGFHYSDTWSLNSYLCTWLPNALLYIKNAHSLPIGMNCDEYEIIIGKIIDGFNEWLKIIEDWEGDQKIADEGLELFKKYFGHLWY